jgi:hypothetical protein
MMARVVFEFFRPRLSQPGLFLLGVIAQDEHDVLYRSVPDVQLPDDVDADFYGLRDRGRFMNDDLLHRSELFDPESSTHTRLRPNDERLLPTLRERGTAHFIYSAVRDVAGSAADAAAAEVDRLRGREERRDAVLEVADPATRALLEAYA